MRAIDRENQSLCCPDIMQSAIEIQLEVRIPRICSSEPRVPIGKYGWYDLGDEMLTERCNTCGIVMCRLYGIDGTMRRVVKRQHGLWRIPGNIVLMYTPRFSPSLSVESLTVLAAYSDLDRALPAILRVPSFWKSFTPSPSTSQTSFDIPPSYSTSV